MVGEIGRNKGRGGGLLTEESVTQSGTRCTMTVERVSAALWPPCCSHGTRVRVPRGGGRGEAFDIISPRIGMIGCGKWAGLSIHGPVFSPASVTGHWRGGRLESVEGNFRGGGVKRFFRNLVGSSREIGEIISIDVWVGLGSCGGVIVVCAKFEEFVWK